MSDLSQKDYREKVYQYASEYLKLYKASETIEREVDIDFYEKSRSLGFKMDAGDSFIGRYAKEAFYHSEVFKNVVDSIDDIVFMGTAILSRWRYITHWTQTSLLEKENREWFVLAFEKLAEISANVERRI